MIVMMDTTRPKQANVPQVNRVLVKHLKSRKIVTMFLSGGTKILIVTGYGNIHANQTEILDMANPSFLCTKPKPIPMSTGTFF